MFFGDNDAVDHAYALLPVREEFSIGACPPLEGAQATEDIALLAII